MRPFRDALNLFHPAERRQANALIAALIGAAIVEAGSIALIFPFVAVIGDPAAPAAGWLLALPRQWGLVAAPGDAVIWCGLIVLGAYLIKGVLLSALAWWQYRFIFDRQVSLASRLLSAYLRSPYTFHLQRNSAELLRNLDTEAAWVCSGVLVPGFSLLAEAAVAGVIFLVLVSAHPAAAAAALGVLVAGGAAYDQVIRRRAVSWGARQQAHHGTMIKWVQQGLGGAKEAKVLGREAYFIDAFANSSREYVRSLQSLRTLNDVARLAIETATVAGVVGLVLLIGGRDSASGMVLPTLGLFAMGVLRLMPSMNRIAQGLTQLRYYAPSVGAVQADLRALELPPAEPSAGAAQALPFHRTIELRSVAYRYPGADRDAICGLSCSIRRGQMVAFVGPSGAGKTTLLDMLLGLLVPTSGHVLVDGHDLHARAAAWQRRIGYVPQRLYLLDDTVRRNVAFGVPDAHIDDGQVWAALRTAQLEPFIRSLPQGLDATVGEQGVRFSAGQRQRLGIARALYHEPDVLVLDEATAALDTATERDIVGAVAALRGERTILLIAHRSALVEACDQVFVLKQGRLDAAGAPAEVGAAS